jgi:hypothetical protein
VRGAGPPAPRRFVSAPGRFSKKNLRGLIREAKMSGPGGSFERAIVVFADFPDLEMPLKKHLRAPSKPNGRESGAGSVITKTGLYTA